MDTKKIGGIVCLLIIIIFILAMMTGGSNTKENKTITVGEVTFTTPVTNNNTTTFTRTPTGGITWAYEDYENNISVYVCDEIPPGYDVNEKFDELSGYNQMRPIGEKWFVVCADRASDKDMVFKSAHMD